MRILLIDGHRQPRRSATSVVASGLAGALRERGVEVGRTTRGGLRGRPDALVYVDFWSHYPRNRHFLAAHPGVPSCYFAADPPWNRRPDQPAIPSVFDVLMHPLQEACDRWNSGVFPRWRRFDEAARAKRCHYVPRGVDAALGANAAKPRHPVIIVDTDMRYAPRGWSDNDATLWATLLLRAERPEIRTVLLGARDARATRSYPQRVSPRTMRRLYRDAWVYVTNIRGSYELPVIEAQMAGACVLDVRHKTRDKAAIRPELYAAGRSGLSVPHRTSAIASALRRLIAEHDPAVPRHFALHHHAWNRSARLLVTALEAALRQRP